MWNCSPFTCTDPCNVLVSFFISVEINTLKARCAEINIINNTPNARDVATFPKVRVPGHLVLDGNRIWWRGNSLDNAEIKPWAQQPPYIDCPDVMQVDRRDLVSAQRMWGNTRGYPGNQFDRNGNQWQYYPSDAERRDQRAGWKANVYAGNTFVPPVPTSVQPPVQPSVTNVVTTAPAVPTQPVATWKCIQSCSDGISFLQVGNVGRGVQCRGTDSRTCAWYEDAACTILKPQAIAPTDEISGVICSNFNGGWCQEARNQVSWGMAQSRCAVSPPPPPPPLVSVVTTTPIAVTTTPIQVTTTPVQVTTTPVQVTTTVADSTSTDNPAPVPTPAPSLPPGWKCIRSCADKGNYVRVGTSSQNGQAYIQCAGPWTGKCSWYSDAACQVVAPNEFAAANVGGNRCFGYGFGWCLEGARILWWNQSPTVCAR